MICHNCGKKIKGEGQPYQVDTYTVWIHKGCRRWCPRQVTARVPEENWESVDGEDRDDWE